ncbi:MAG: helix-turn-helix transcriptional regulator [Rhizobiaceae bacterium]|nr:helix-turn-helix transcriptional regulator [Rhizobiaceae bacterium]
MSDALRIAHGPFGRVALLDMDRSLVRHAHPYCHVLLKVEGDDTQFLVGERIAPLTDELAVLVNAWEPHAYVHDSKRGRTIILALYIEPQWLAEFRPNWEASSKAGFFLRTAGEITPLIRTFAHDLATSMVHAPEAKGEHENLLSRLMIAVIERFSDWQRVAPSFRDAAVSSGMDWRIRRAVRGMRADPGATPNVDRLARTAGLSRAHFFRLFGQATGVTPNVFLNVLRLESAVTSMVATQEPVAAVSDRLGFSAPSHFTRFFRDHAGVTPTAFREVTRLGSEPLRLSF